MHDSRARYRKGGFSIGEAYSRTDKHIGASCSRGQKCSTAVQLRQLNGRPLHMQGRVCGCRGHAAAAEAGAAWVGCAGGGAAGSCAAAGGGHGFHQLRRPVLRQCLGRSAG